MRFLLSKKEPNGDQVIHENVLSCPKAHFPRPIAIITRIVGCLFELYFIIKSTTHLR